MKLFPSPLQAAPELTVDDPPQGLLDLNRPDADAEQAKVVLWGKIPTSLSPSNACMAPPNFPLLGALPPAMLRPPPVVDNPLDLLATSP